MAQIVKLRRSSVSGQKPTNSNLQLGELALNTTDGKVYMAVSGSLGPSVEELISTNTVNTGSLQLVGSITASAFSGSAVGLTNVPFRISGSDIAGNQSDKTFTKLHFDSDTGLNVSESAPGTAFISIGSHFKDIFVSGSPILSATGSDAFEVIGAGGLGISTSITDTNGNGYIKELTISAASLSSSLNNRMDTITGSITTLSSSLNSRINTISGSVNTLNMFTSSVVLTSQTSSMNVLSASYALTAAFALNAGAGGGGGASIGSYNSLVVTSASSTWSFAHNTGQRYPIFQVFDNNGYVVIPSQIQTIDDNNANIIFPSPQTGRVIASLGGGNGLTEPFTSSSLWTVNHNLGTDYPDVTIWDSNRNIVFPNRIESVNANQIKIYFSQAISGNVSVSRGGHIVSGSGAVSLGDISWDNLLNKPSGLVSGSSQLTGSYDTRYVLSGSITQTTWDNIASKPSDIVSSSAQIGAFGFATTGSNTFQGNQTINGNLVVTGSLTAQQFIVSSSVTYLTTSFSSGSTRFGDSIDDTHQFTGSVLITGSLTSNGNILPSADGLYTLGTSGARFSNVYSANGVIGNLYGTTIRAATNSVLFGSNQTNYWGGFIGNNSTSSANFILNYTSSAGLGGDNGYKLQIYPSGSASGSLYVSGSSSFSGSVNVTGSLNVNNSVLTLTGSLPTPLIIGRSGGTNSNIQFSNGVGTMYAGSVGSSFGIGPAQDLATTSQLTIFGGTGNVSIQNGGTPTDNGYRLQVIGSGSLSGSLYVSGSSNFTGSLNVTGSSFLSGNSSISSSLNAEIAPSLTAGNWTSTNMTVSGGTIVYTTGTIGTTSPTTPLSITVGKVYKVTYTLSGSINAYTSITLGGSNVQLQVGTITIFILAQTTGNLIISNATVGDPSYTISSLSIKQLTDNTGTLTVDGAVKFNSTLGINNLGIGTSGVPTAPLQVVDNNSNGIRVTRNTNAGQYIAMHEGNGACHTIEGVGDKPLRINNTTSTSFGLEFWTRNLNRAQISSLGNWLVGTETDSGYKGDINGTLRIQSGSIITGSLQVSGSQNITGSLNVTGSSTIKGDLTVQGNLTAQQFIVSSSVTYLTESFASGSHTFGNTLDDTHNFTGSVNITGSLQLSGSLSVNSLNPTLGQFVGSQNGYVEFSVRNTSTAASASGDIVVYADTGTPTTNYIDMGINNSGVSSSYGYAGAFVGKVLDGYLYNTGGDLWIGNASTGSKNIYIFNTGSAKPMITITPNSFQLTGSLIVSSSGVATSLIGSGSGVFTVDGTSGRLFQIDDSLSGSLFSVNTAGGLPLVEGFSDNTVRIGQFGQKALFVSQSMVGFGMETPIHKVDISGSLRVTNQIVIGSSQVVNQNTASLASGTQTISTNATSSYTSVFYNYTLASGSNARAGQLMAVWNGNSITYTDNSTTDIGTTGNVALTASLSTGNVVLSTVLPTTGWTIKSFVNLL